MGVNIFEIIVAAVAAMTAVLIMQGR